MENEVQEEISKSIADSLTTVGKMFPELNFRITYISIGDVYYKLEVSSKKNDSLKTVRKIIAKDVMESNDHYTLFLNNFIEMSDTTFGVGEVVKEVETIDELNREIATESALQDAGKPVLSASVDLPDYEFRIPLFTSDHVPDMHTEILRDFMVTIESMNGAIKNAGGTPISNDRLMVMTLLDFLNTASRNGIRFIHIGNGGG